jgi:phosphinothricin acetyltransferase
MRFVDCTPGRHAQAILDILNDAIVTSTALYDYVPRPPEAMTTWFEAKRQRNFPVVGAEDDDGTLLGFASYGPFRNWPAYKYSVENGVYVHRDHRGKGLGRALMLQLIERARAQDLHVIVAGIDRDNAASIALHESLGFEPCGVVRHAGFKFGRWLDLAFYELVLDGSPSEPKDG